MRSFRFRDHPPAPALLVGASGLACWFLFAGAPIALAQPAPAKAAPAKAAPKPAKPGAAPSATSTAAVIETIEGTEEVQRLYMEGDDALKRLAFSEADIAFTKAWALSKSFDVAGKLGETKLDLGKHREAAQYLSFALRNALPSTRASRREQLKKALDEAKKKLATVKLTASIVEAKIAIDGAAVDPIFLGPEVFVDPGRHTFEASADGYTTATQSADTRAGEIFVVTLTLERAIAKPPASATASATPAGTPWPAAALGGAGGLGLVLGAVFVGVAEGRKNDAHALARNTLTADGKPKCPKQGPGPTADCDKVRAAAADVDTFGNAGIGAFVAGGVLLAAAAGYVLFFPSGEPAKDTPKAGRIVPVVGPEGAGFVWRGSF